MFIRIADVFVCAFVVLSTVLGVVDERVAWLGRGNRVRMVSLNLVKGVVWAAPGFVVFLPC